MLKGLLTFIKISISMFRYPKMIYPHRKRLVTPKIAERRKNKSQFCMQFMANCICHLLFDRVTNGGAGQDKWDGFLPGCIDKQVIGFWPFFICDTFCIDFDCDAMRFSHSLQFIHTEDNMCLPYKYFRGKILCFLNSLSWLPPQHNMVAS